MKKALSFVVTILSVIFILAACGNSNDARLEGRWIMHGAGLHVPQGYEFQRGGQGVWFHANVTGNNETPITWSSSGDRLEITIVGHSAPTIYYYEFSDDTTLFIREINWSEGTRSTLIRVD